MPALPACFSISLSVSITINGKYGRPCWLTKTTLDTSSAKADRSSAGVARTGARRQRFAQNTPVNHDNLPLIEAGLRTIRIACPSDRRCLASMERKMTFSTTRPIRMTVSRPANTVGIFELVLVLEDEPAEAARAGRDAEHQLGGDQRAPGERPADLEAGEDARKRRRDQDLRDVAKPRKTVIAPDHAQACRTTDRKPRMGVERDRPQHRMHHHEHQAAVAEAEPDQRQRQQRDRRQRVEHRRSASRAGRCRPAW